MVKDKSNKYIDTYKELETLLSEKGTSIYEYEQGIFSDSDQKKMQLCRLTRNFIQHEQDLFIAPTKEMTDFLAEQIIAIKMQDGIVKDFMTRIAPLTGKDTISDAAKKLAKMKFVPVVNKDKECIGVVTDAVIRRVLAEKPTATKISSIEKILLKLETVNQSVYISDIPRPLDAIVLNSAEKYVGVVRL